MPPRFTQVQPQQPPSLQGRFTQVSPAQSALGITKGVNSLFGLGSKMTGSPNLSGVSQGLGGVLNLGQGAFQLGQGRTLPGALSIASGTGNLAGATGRFTQIPALQAGGSALGGAAGLAGGGYALSQGDIPGGVSGLLSGGAGLAGLAPAGSTIGGVGVSSAGAYGSSIAGALGSLALPLIIGKIVETGVNAGLGEGPFGQTKLPFGRGNQFSSADNLASQTSKYKA